MNQHWYDVTAGRFDQLPAMLEAVEKDGFEVVGLINTGAVAPASGIMTAGKPQVMPVIAAVCRTPKLALMTEEKHRIRLFADETPPDNVKPFIKGGA